MTCNLPYNFFSQLFQIPLLPRLGGMNSIVLTQISPPLTKRTHFLSPSQITPVLNSTYSWNLLHFFSVLHNCFLGDSFGRQSIPTVFPKSGPAYLLTFPQNNSYSGNFLEVKWWICLIAVAAGLTHLQHSALGPTPLLCNQKNSGAQKKSHQFGWILQTFHCHKSHRIKAPNLVGTCTSLSPARYLDLALITILYFLSMHSCKQN